MRRNHVDCTMASWVSNAEIRERNENANAYSKSVQRRRKANGLMADVVYGITFLTMVLVPFIAYFVWC